MAAVVVVIAKLKKTFHLRKGDAKLKGLRTLRTLHYSNWLGKGNVALTYYILHVRISNLGFHHFPAASMEYTGVDLGALVRIVFLQIAETSCIR